MKKIFTLIGFTTILGINISIAQVAWSTEGNANSGNEFLGTTNNTPVIFKANNKERMRLTNIGRLGIGISSPQANLHVFSGSNSSCSAKIRLEFASNINSNCGWSQSKWDLTSDNMGYFKISNPSLVITPITINGADGTVGLGTTSNPGLNYVDMGGKLKLDVNGHARFGTPNDYMRIAFDGSNGVLDNYGNGSMLINYHSGKDVFIGTGPVRSNVMVGGNLGVGANSDPAYRLMVEGQARFGAGSNYMRIGYDGTSGVLDHFGNGIMLINYHSGKDVHIGTGATPSNLVVGGWVGIGTAGDPNYKLSVNGIIRAKEVRVETNWSDYVFEEDYKLLPIYEVEQFILKNKHLPGVIKGSVIEEEGLSLGEMQAKHMEKIEELTLYIIDLQKQIDEMKRNNTTK